MCNICNIVKHNKGKVYLDNDKWLITHHLEVDMPVVIWKHHSKFVDCDTCILWAQLQCRVIFGKGCSYHYDMERIKKHFHFYVLGEAIESTTDKPAIL